MPASQRKSTKICDGCYQEYHIADLESEIKQQSIPGSMKMVYYCSDCR